MNLGVWHKLTLTKLISGLMNLFFQRAHGVEKKDKLFTSLIIWFLTV